MNGTGGFTVPHSPSSGQIAPGSITYTTSTNPDGQVMYHPFRAVPASYQTPQGIVHGIQWVPAEATQIVPTGAQPATAEFAASWNRGHSSREDERVVEKWQRSEEKRRKKEEKESIKHISKQYERDEMEIRTTRERDVNTRGRRRSFYGEGTPPTATTYPTPGSAAYGAYSSNMSSTTDLDRTYGDLEVERKENYGTRPRKYSPSRADRSSFYGPVPLGPGVYSSPTTTYTTPTGYPSTGSASPYHRATSPYKPPGAFSTSPNVKPRDFPPSTYPGGPDPIASVASSYAPRAHSPYSARVPSPMPQPPPRAPSPYARPPSRAPSPYHGQQSSSSYPAARVPSPYVPPPQIHSVYSRGHVLEGQTNAAPRSRAPSPMPTPGYPRAPSPMPGAPVGSGFSSSPRMGAGIGGEPMQLAAPEAFSRPPNAAQPYTPFNLMRIQDMDQFYDQIPRMPLVLDTHDVYHQDWIRFMNDLALAWAGKMPIPEFARGVPPKRSSLVADLINLWNESFFRARRVEVVLYRGRERRSGPHTGTVDNHLPMHDFDSDSDLSLSSSSSSSESEDDRYYGRGVDLTESKRRRRERKEEKKRRKKEKKLRKKAKERERQYSLYLTYVVPREMPVPGGHNFYG